MDTGTRLAHIIGILRLNRSAIEFIAQDTGALLPGLVIITGAMFLGSLPEGIGNALGSLIWAPAASFIGVGIAHFLARLFQGKGSFIALWRAGSHASVLNALGILGFIPLVGGLAAIGAGVYGLVVFVVIMTTTQMISRGAAIAIALIPAILSGLFLVLLLLMTRGSAVAPFIYTLF